MTGHPDDFFPLLQQLCLEAGVKVVYTPCLPKAPIHGLTRWFPDNTPLIQLSARYNQNDRFWFTFFHEAGHILLHGRKYISLEDDCFEAEDKAKEAEADAFAVRWTFSEEEERAVIESGDLTESDIINFAQKFGTHPAMIIGRFHHKISPDEQEDQTRQAGPAPYHTRSRQRVDLRNLIQSATALNSTQTLSGQGKPARCSCCLWQADSHNRVTKINYRIWVRLQLFRTRPQGASHRAEWNRPKQGQAAAARRRQQRQWQTVEACSEAVGMSNLAGTGYVG